MTAKRFVVLFGAPFLVGLIVSCGGGGGSTDNVVVRRGSQAENPLVPRATKDDLVIEQAKKRREEAIAQLQAVRARNDARKSQYANELEDFKDAKIQYAKNLKAFKVEDLQYKSLRQLDFAKNIKTQGGLKKWYSDIIREYPGTDVSEEAQRRLAGKSPKIFPVPPQPEAPSPPVAPKEPQYENEPLVPDAYSVAQAVANDEESPPLSAYDTTRRGTGEHSGKVYVHGYTNKNGVYVPSHYRNPPGAGSSKGRR